LAYLPSSKRLRALAPTFARVITDLPISSPLFCDNLRLRDSTPVPCGQSRGTAGRSELAGYAAYGWCRSHNRCFWGLRLYLLCAPGHADRLRAGARAPTVSRHEGRLQAKAVSAGPAAALAPRRRRESRPRHHRSCCHRPPRLAAYPPSGVVRPRRGQANGSPRRLGVVPMRPRSGDGQSAAPSGAMEHAIAARQLLPRQLTYPPAGHFWCQRSRQIAPRREMMHPRCQSTSIGRTTRR
jgi:hypothetical protein